MKYSSTMTPSKTNIPRSINRHEMTGSEAAAHQQRVRQELKAAGITWWGFLFSDAQAVPSIIHPDEHIMAAVFGYGKAGWALIIATDRRVVYVDTKPLFKRSDDITYDLVGGVTFEHVGLIATVVLHTRIGDYDAKTTNKRSSALFTDYIERRCLEHINGREAWDDNTNQTWNV